MFNGAGHVGFDPTVAIEVLIDVGPPDAIDSRYAHKPGIISKDDTLYHFYCAVSKAKDKRWGEVVHSEVRGISVAWSGSYVLSNPLVIR